MKNIVYYFSSFILALLLNLPLLKASDINIEEIIQPKCHGDDGQVVYQVNGDADKLKIYKLENNNVFTYLNFVQVTPNVTDTIELTNSTFYRFILYNGNTPLDTQFANINQNPTEIHLNDTRSFPVYDQTNGSIFITATGGTLPYSFQWNSSSVPSTIPITNIQNGAYEFELQDFNGCVISRDYFMPALPQLNITWNSTDNYCAPETIDFELDFFGNSMDLWEQYITYNSLGDSLLPMLIIKHEFGFEDTLSIHNLTTFSQTFTSPGTYNIQGYLMAGYSGAAPNQFQKIAQFNDIFVEIAGKLPSFNINSDSICVEDSLYVMLLDASNVSWQFETGFPIIDTSVTAHIYSNSGTYNLNVTYSTLSGECPSITDTFSIPIHVFEQSDFLNGLSIVPQIDFYPEEACEGEDIKISLSNYSGNSIEWYINGTLVPELSNKTSFSTELEVFGNNQFQVDVQVYNNCSSEPFSASRSFNVSGNTPVNQNLYSISISSDTACVGNPVLFEFDDWYYNNITWNFGDGNTSSAANVSHSYNQPGTYQVVIQVTNACGQTLTEYKTVVVSNNSSTSINSELINFQSIANKACINDQILLSCKNVAEKYIIDFGDGQKDSLSNVSYNNVLFKHTYENIGFYNAVLKVISSCGAQTLDTITIEIKSTGHTPSVQDPWEHAVVWFQGANSFWNNVESCEPVNVISLVAGTHFDWTFSPGNGPGNFNPIELSEEDLFTQVIFENNNLTDTNGQTIDLVVTNGCGNTASFEHFIGVDYNPCSNFLTYLDIAQPNSCNAPYGSVNVQVFNTSTYAYEWSHSDEVISSSVDSLMPGTYSVTITNTNSLQEKVSSFTISDPNSLSLDVSSEPAICTMSNGMAQVNVQGGTPPYAYVWNNGLQGASIMTNAYGGIYAVTVTDANSCQKFKVVQVPNVNGPQITVQSLKQPSCNGSEDGYVHMNIAGTPPYTYFWSNGENTKNINSVAAGNYILSVTDGNGCSGIKSVTLSEPDPLEPIIENINKPSCSVANGEVTFSANGGTPNYTFDLSNGNNGSIISNLPGGIYTVTVTDENGCAQSKTFTMDEFPVKAVKNHVKSASCNINNGELGLRLISLDPSNYDMDSAKWITAGLIDYNDLQEDPKDTIYMQPSGPQDIVVYGTEITTQNICQTYRRVPIPKKQPGTVEVCVISVNEEDDNVVTWKPSTDPNVSTYKVYREDYNSGEFIHVHTANLNNETNIYVDKDVDASIKSHKYRIRAVDQCDTESAWGPPHTSTHLSSIIDNNDVIHLDWQPYAGFTADSVQVYVNTTAGDSNFYVLETLPGNAIEHSIDINTNTEILNAYQNQTLTFYVEYPNVDTCEIVQKTEVSEHGNGKSNDSKCCLDEIVNFACFVDVLDEVGAGSCNGEIGISVYGGEAPYTLKMEDEEVDYLILDVCPGEYEVEVIDNNGMEAHAMAVVGTQTGLGEVIEQNGIRIFPNPTAGGLTIAFINTVSDKQLTFQVWDLSGSILQEEVITVQEQVSIDLNSELPSGYYHIVLRGNTINEHFKIVKE